MPDERQPRILVIDDNAQNAALLRAQLERAGYQVSSAASGRLGIEKATAGPPDLILLDIMMPGLDGYEVCARLKADEPTRDIPVVMLTSLNERADKIRALDMGADDFLTKPADRAELLARVRSLIRLKQQHDELIESRDEMVRQAEQLAAEKSRVEAILYSMSDGVATTDLAGRLTLLNPAGEAICGTTVEAVGGRPWAEALGVRDRHGDALDDARSPVQEVLQTGRPSATRELSLWRPDERQVVISLAAAPVRRAGGETAGVVTVFRDVTRQREVERMKEEFVSLVSHELRTPLASVFGYSELLLLDRDLDDQGRGFVETIHHECQRLNDLVNDFLDVELMESGRFSYHPRPLLLAEVLAEAEQDVSTQLVERRIIHELPAERIVVHADKQRLLQVLINLVSNAIKYSPNGGDVRVRAEVDQGSVVVAVVDRGLGLPPEAMEKLFTKFYRVERPEHQRVSGTGLGLAICKAIVEGWGGQIWAVSDGLGRGTTFLFTVPRET